MRSSHRDRISIIIDILKATKVEGGTTKTRIIYNASLSHYQMKNHVRSLVENHVLYDDLHAPKVKTAEEGLRVIEAYTRIEDMISSQQLASPPSTILRQQVKLERWKDGVFSYKMIANIYTCKQPANLLALDDNPEAARVLALSLCKHGN
ncbi:MAG TPA: winged helix-turn-helix domain-containing protein [Nitrososphaera sp.]|nr:winged helix-turn-helix domain-containing protein [Nitrososphaera sp.]